MVHLAKHLEELIHLRTVVEHGSINSAASRIGISQPALTRSIKRLEQSLGVKLLNRTARGVSTTIYGEALVDYARSVDAELQRAAWAVETLKGGMEGQLRVGGLTGVMTWLFPETLVELQKAKPNLTVRVVEAQPSALMAMLRLGELDLIVRGRNAGSVEEDLVAETLGLDRFDIFVRRSHPLLQQASAHDLAALAASQTWVLPTTSGPSLAMIEHEFARHKLATPRRRLEVSSTTVLARLLRSTDCLAVTTSQALAGEILAGEVRSLRGNWRLPEIETAMYTSSKRAQSPGMLAFMRCLRRIARLKQTPFANFRARYEQR